MAMTPAWVRPMDFNFSFHEISTRRAAVESNRVVGHLSISGMPTVYARTGSQRGSSALNWEIANPSKEHIVAERLIPGDVAPNFTLPDETGKSVSLSDFQGRNTIVYFYPAASTPGCTKEACDFRDTLASLQAAGYDVVGVSPDPVKALAKFAAEEHLTFPLLSDEDHAVADAYAAWGEKKNYGKTYMGLIRSTIVVDSEGKVSLAQYNVRATGHVAKLRRDLKLDK